MHLNPPFRVEHVGSLKRPAELLAKRKDYAEKKCSPEELREVEDRAIEGVVRFQREVGLKGITDGEFRRNMFLDGVFDKLDGMTYVPECPAYKFKKYMPSSMQSKILQGIPWPSWICTGKLKRTKPLYRDEFEGLKKFARPEEVKNLKMTVCTPEMLHLRHYEHTYEKGVYENDAEYFADLVQIYREELRSLHAIGCRNVQFDDPWLSYFCHEGFLEGMKGEGIDSDAVLDQYIRNYNQILEDRPEGMTISVHLCRGNFKGQHFVEGGYDRIAARLFNELNVDCYYLEYDTERAGTFEPLKQLPPNKTVVLGLVSTKRGELEEESFLENRITEAATAISNGVIKRSIADAMNQICISPQCGFASHSDGNPVTEKDVELKLRLLSTVAHRVWSQ